MLELTVSLLERTVVWNEELSFSTATLTHATSMELFEMSFAKWRALNGCSADAVTLHDVSVSRDLANDSLNDRTNAALVKSSGRNAAEILTLFSKHVTLSHRSATQKSQPVVTT